MSSASNDNKANQCNPNNSEYAGHQSGYGGTGDAADLNNHANQLNPNSDQFGGASQSNTGPSGGSSSSGGKK
ncbi:unnamed protein product [Didymodactylos carnosus]|uniref:Uncharacterized protein n=1 Tax=Didymodactylos carnosus TaxID=1234261 RepID=A0A8S2Y4M3_9BILA|nr:unnamed protein product [Didymodactylos carnosus]